MFFKDDIFLIGDIGGTNSTFAIADSKKNILTKQTYQSSEIKHFTDTILKFLHEPEQKKYKPKIACFAIAGIINGDRKYAKLTNRDWNIDVDNILVRTPLKKVVLLNDFEAIGFGIDTLKPEQYRNITNNSIQNDGTIALIGAGTGLGMSIAPYNPDRKTHEPLPSEGGHVDLPIISNDTIDIKLQSYLIKNKKYTDAEDIISGRGILNIYNFLLTQKIKHETKIKAIIHKAQDTDKPALITKYALEDKDILCIRTLELFIKYYARIARNLALTTMCSELVIAGGIARKILPALEDVFVEEFTRHPIIQMQKMLELMTIIIIIEPNIGLHGALNVLKK